MGDENLISLQPGTIIAGRYEVVKCLGAGSMGLVYACRHRELSGHLVGVKVLFPEVAQDKVAAARFRNEIFASYGVSHPNVVRAYEYLRDGDLVAYTMEYVGGGDLAERLTRSDILTVQEIMQILSQMCSGVQAIHDAGIVHRDLKPENILLTKEGDIKIADFGIARTGHGPKLTEHGGVVGTIDYVSPEYMLNSQVDWRSDIYAMGILAYEMSTGVSPFRGDSVYATMTKRLKEDPKPPSAHRAEIPPQLDNIILKAMARDPEERYQSAAEMFYDLSELLPEQSITSGAFLQISKHQSESYRGPVAAGTQTENVAVVAAGGGGGMQAAEVVGPSNEIVAKAANSTEDNLVVPSKAYPGVSDVDDHAPTETNIQSLKWNENGSASSELGGHEKDVVDVASHYQVSETIHQPVKMESVLNTPDIKSDTWEDETAGQKVSVVSSVSFNRENIGGFKKRGRGSMARSLWVDIIAGVVTVAIGIGIGLVALRSFQPDLFPGKDVTPVTGADSIDSDSSFYDEEDNGPLYD